MHVKKLLIVALLIPTIAQPAEKPKSGHKLFWTVASAAALAELGDNVTTLRNLSGPGGREHNGLFGPHPSPARLVGTNLAISAAWGFTAYELETHHHPRIARMMLVGSAALGGTLTVQNVRHGQH